MTDQTPGSRARNRWTRLRHVVLLALPTAVLAAVVTPTLASAVAPHTATSASALSPAQRCTTAYLASHVREAHVTIDSATLETSGSFTPPGYPAAITGLPEFCAVR
jgi:hypothetical protein